ncbi:MAG TPA: hypothetical protein DEB40_07910 [Elusimicrobia bacterium]|nr:hypothetical protein [Elusimicrobiota bacterium]HBT61654.1 hypothetical protein [Elusimicrobiota bacterium]
MAFKAPSAEAVTKAFSGLRGARFITAGGFKAVYDCTIEGVRQAFKLAYIPPVTDPHNEEEIAKQKEVLTRVKREIALLGKLKRPEIVKLGKMGPQPVEINGDSFVAYSEEFLDGDNLWKILRKGGTKPTEAELKALFTTLLHAIEEMWSLKIIHRDIKPCNIIKLNEAARPFVLLDLGIAYVIGETALTHAGVPATHRYIAPEMLRPDFRETLDYRSDLYTTALTIYEYAAQRHPIAGDPEDMMITISRALRDTPSSLHGCRPDLSEAFCNVIDQLLKKRPALRPGNLQMLLQQAGVAP